MKKTRQIMDKPMITMELDDQKNAKTIRKNPI